MVLVGTDGPEKLTASASRTGNSPRAKESGKPSCPLSDSGSPWSLENPPPQPLPLPLSVSSRLLRVHRRAEGSPVRVPVMNGANFWFAGMPQRLPPFPSFPANPLPHTDK